MFLLKKYITGIEIFSDTGLIQSFWQNKIDNKLNAYAELVNLPKVEALNKALDVALSLHEHNKILKESVDHCGISFMLAIQLKEKLNSLGL